MESGRLYVLLGPTNAGKTSLLRVMAGLDRPSTGRVLIGGQDVTGRSVRRRNVAMVYQQFVNYPSFTVYENIASPLRLKGMKRAEIDRKVKETAELLHIEPLLRRLPAELSGGQQQRCAIARALGSRKPSCCCSTSRSSISTTSCARSCARSCAPSSPGGIRSSSTPPPSPWRRSSWAAMPSSWARGGCCSRGRRSRSITGRARPGSPRSSPTPP
ncbi:MAG: ABC transporter ATP-binding protein [Geminicoccaceae bacterium]